MIGDLFPTLKKLRGGNEGGLVGLELETDSISAVEVHTNGSAQLVACAIGPLPPGAVDDGEVADHDAVAAGLRSLFSTHKLSRRVRLGIANQRVVVRTLRLPAIEDPKELASAVRFTAQEQIPMPIEEAILDHRVIGGAPASEGMPPQLDVVVAAARSGMIDSWLETMRAADLEPVGIDLSAFGLIRALGDVLQTDRTTPTKPATATLYCNIGDVTNLAVARGRACLFTRVAPVGLEDIVAALTGATGLSREHAQQWIAYVGLAQPPESLEGDREMIARVRAALENGASALLDELRLSLDFYSAQEGAVPIKRILLSGSGSTIPGLAARMEPALHLPIETRCPNALSELDANSAARLTLSYGLALEE
jgi:type IV pilus assembly protein PilM